MSAFLWKDKVLKAGNRQAEKYRNDGQLREAHAIEKFLSDILIYERGDDE